MRISKLMGLIGAASVLALTACGQDAQTTSSPAATADTVPQNVEATENTNEALVTFLDDAWEARVAASPEYQTYLGRKTNYGEWDDRSTAGDDAEIAMIREQLETLRSRFDRDQLDEEGQLNYDLFEYQAENALNLDRFRDHQFVLSQFRGVHSGIPVTLANYHSVSNKEELDAYLSRVSKIDTVLDQAVTKMEERANAGYTLPAFSYPQIVESARNVITGAPFDDGPASPIYADFKGKLEALDADQAYKDEKLAEIERILIDEVAPAYEDFSMRVADIGGTVEGNFGIGSASGNRNGDAYYNALLASYTTTDMTAEEIHQLGLAEVDRIHGEMRTIMTEVGFEGSLQDFFEFMRTDPQFYYSNTDEDREKYLEDARGYIALMDAKLDDLFITRPKAPVEVRRVEKFREASAGKAFYNQPAPDGSRPGIFYANLMRMEDMPTYQLEALVYHEAIPGHHMQRSIQIEKEGLPKFRQFGGFTAYTEGWGLYSEYLGKEVGLYEDPYSDFGRLAMELWRAARLVVDTGLHYKGWERQVAIDYLTENTPNPEGDCIKAIDRYIVYPGQATAYKIGMIKLQDLRAKAERELGDAYNIAEFHDFVLLGGPMPLSILEQRIDAWIASKK